jgi:hypothetical protein
MKEVFESEFLFSFIPPFLHHPVVQAWRARSAVVRW